MQGTSRESTLKRRKLGVSAILAIVLVVAASGIAFSRGEKPETIKASAHGTSTQLGQDFGVTLQIYAFSSPEDRQALLDAYQKGQNQGLVKALSKMKAVGHCAVSGTPGYDVSYIRMTPTPTGRRIVFVTNRRIRFGEAYFDTQSQAYDLTAGQFDLDDSDANKSTGVLYPAAQLTVDKEGELRLDLNQNPWKLVDVLDWKGTPGVN